jgi:hypothetical protein
MDFITKTSTTIGSIADPLDLPPHLAEIAERDFGETNETRMAALKELRNRIDALPENERLVDMSDLNLVRFLRNRKYNMDRVVASTIAYTKFRADNADLYDIDPDALLGFDGVFKLMIGSAPDYRVIFTLMPKKIVTLFTEEFVKAHPQFLLRFNIWSFELMSFMPAAQVCGIMGVLSFMDFSMWDNIALARMVNVQDRIKAFTFLTSCLGMKVKGLFVFEAPMLVQGIFTILSAFMSTKLRSRFHLGGKNYSILQEHFKDNMDALPLSFGGNAPDNAAAPWLLQEISKMRAR